MRFLRIVVWMSAAFGAVSAQGQSAYGPGGLFLIPSAFGAPKHTVQVGSMFGYQDMWAVPVPHEHYLFQNAVGYGVSDKLTVGFSQIVMLNVNHRATWGAHGKYVLAEEEGNYPAVAVSAVWMPVWHWRTETVALSASKTVELTDAVKLHLHAGAIHARWMNGVRTDKHPYAPKVGADGYPEAPSDRYDPKRPLTRQAPFGGIDLELGQYVKLTAEARARMISDHPDAIPGMVGIILTPPKLGRIGFAMGNDGLGDRFHLKIGIGYNIGTVE